MAQSHKRTNSTDVPWYNGDIGPKLGPKAREILEGYSKIPADQVESHVSKIVGLLSFLYSLIAILQRRNSFLNLSDMTSTTP